MSTACAVSFQISSAVVRRWMSGFAGLSNCCGMMAFGIFGEQFLRFRNGPLHAERPRRQNEFRAKKRKQLAALDRHGFRHSQDEAIPLLRGHESERDAGIARGRLDKDGFAGLDFPCLLKRLDHGHADTVFHARDRIEKFELRQEVGLDALFLGELVEAHDGRIADGLEDGTVDAAPAWSAIGFLNVVLSHDSLWVLVAGPDPLPLDNRHSVHPIHRERARETCDHACLLNTYAVAE